VAAFDIATMYIEKTYLNSQTEIALHLLVDFDVPVSTKEFSVFAVKISCCFVRSFGLPIT